MHGTKDVYNHAKNGAIDIETPLDIFNMQMLRKKSFYETAKTWDFFLQDFNSGDLISCDLISRDQISWDFIGSPYTILGGKGFKNSGLYFQWHFVLELRKIGTFLLKFLFPGFFFRKLFSGDFLTKILVNIRRQTVLIPLQSSLKSLPSWVTLFQHFTNSCNICGSVNKF